MNTHTQSPAGKMVSRWLWPGWVVLALVGSRPSAPHAIGAEGSPKGRSLGPPTAHAAMPAPVAQGRTADWIRAGLNTNRPIWGLRGGLLWGLPPASGRPDGPRGLIRLRYPVLTNGAYDLINFIAIEPVVRGHKGFSELEHSSLDSIAGKRLWVEDSDVSGTSPAPPQAGQLIPLASGGEALTVRVRVERFANGAHVALTLTQRSNEPDELELAIHAKDDSAPIEHCILTATMGNKARTRLLWLREEVVSSLTLYPDYKGPDFAPHQFFPLERLHRTASGDVLAAITSDEANPSDVEPFPRSWRYGGFPVTQYWKKPAGSWHEDLHVAVNARHTYWRSRHPIPGGIAFENFEMRERFYEGQRFVFGITSKPPGELGFRSPRETPRPATPPRVPAVR